MRVMKVILSAAVPLTFMLSPAFAGPAAPRVQHGPTPRPPHTSPTVTTPHTTPIAQKISAHPQLASRVQSMLPPGTTLQQASSGFKNQGQFIAALHVSQNLGIPFADLKSDMVNKHLSLGQSIQALKKTDSHTTTTAVKRAEREADDDIKGAAHKTVGDTK